MTDLVERKGFKIEATTTSKKKTKKKKSKSTDLGHVRIIDDDAPIVWGTTTESNTIADDEIVSFDDAPIVVGVIDERPSEIREKERFNDVKRWRTAAFEEVPEPSSIGPQPKPTKSHPKRNSSDDSDPDIDRRQPRRNDDPDLSLPKRKTHQNDDDPSPPRRKRQSDDDPSPSRRRDLSPPRRKNDDPSPPRRKRQSGDDPSPPRRRDPSPPRRKHDDSSSSRRKHRTNDDFSPSRRHDSSPPRRKHKYNDDSNPSTRRDTSSPRKQQPRDDDGDASPPRRRDKSSPSHQKKSRHSRQESPSSSTYRRQIKEESSSSSSTHRRSKQESPPPPSQPAKSERRRLAEHKEQVAERYAQWGRGLAQVRQVEHAVKDYIEQAAKPLARYRDDADLDTMLKEKEREDDPMLKYLSKKTSDVGDRTNNSNSTPPKPRYRGPDPQKNRFDIWPGYRWDGVDRSNGYEKKLFESIAHRHAKTQEAYLWSVEDM
ncbi:unnamed protein product [Rotaria sp. Silwood1]|nr:unnamed protein product [Rotaria sp. Silwood1]CAF0785537.1 unnamed protein product [Rotaria sp. Silwood1]